MKARIAIFTFIAIASFGLPAHAKKKHKHNEPAPTPQPTPSAQLSPSENLSQFLNAHLDEIVAPLGAPGIKNPQTIIDLKESIADGMSRAPQTAKPAYQAAVQVCDALSEAVDEREKEVAKLRASTTVKGDSSLGAIRKDHPGWIEDDREIREQDKRNKDAAQGDSFFTASQNSEWTKRSAQLRAGIQQLYQRQREIEREAKAATPAPMPPAAKTTGT